MQRRILQVRKQLLYKSIVPSLLCLFGNATFVYDARIEVATNNHQLTRVRRQQKFVPGANEVAYVYGSGAIRMLRAICRAEVDSKDYNGSGPRFNNADN
jgi:hypothetical protein